MTNVEMLEKRLSAIYKVLFLTLETLRSRASGRSLKILFSVSDQEAKIRRFMSYTRHSVVFADPKKVALTAFDVVVPLNMEDAYFLSDVNPVEQNWVIPMPPRASLELCDDKSMLNAFLQKHGFQNYIPQLDDAGSPPFILKKKVGESSRGCHLIKNQEDIRKYRAEIESSDYFTQRFIVGPYEYADHILFDGQRVLASLGIRYKYSHDYPIKQQDRHLYTSLVACPFLELWSRMLALIGYRGVCCVNYKLVDNQPKLLEINPRCGASLTAYFFTFLRKVRH